MLYIRWNIKRILKVMKIARTGSSNKRYTEERGGKREIKLHETEVSTVKLDNQMEMKKGMRNRSRLMKMKTSYENVIYRFVLPLFRIGKVLVMLLLKYSYFS